MNDREKMLGAIRARAKKLRPHPGMGPVPARGKVEGKARIRLFQSMASEAAATLAEAATMADVPGLIAQYLRENNLPARLRLAPDPRISGLDWASQPLLETSTGASDGNDQASVTPALAGLAETGTLALGSSQLTPATLNFLPETHIVVVSENEIVGTFEELWSRARREVGADWPRSLNLVTGPSRSADIEQTLLMGAHGPKRLHIILVATFERS